MNYTGTNHYLDFIKTNVYDGNGNNNSRLDPGETANLTVCFKNIGGANFSNLTTFIHSSDPYIAISDNCGYFGELLIDSTKENINDKYVVSVNPSCPQGYSAQFCLIATDGMFMDTFEFSLDIGSYDYLAWNPDLTPSSGQTIHNTLASLGYNGHHVTLLPIGAQLDAYKAIFVCFGVYPNNYFTNAWSLEVTALVDYLNRGGRVYLEGGEVWAYDANNGGYNFGPMFGLVGVEVGTNNMGPVIGQANTFTQGMHFNYGGANNSMDHIEPTTGFTIFEDENDDYVCGIAHDAGTYRTIGTSFELGGLDDAASPSTKSILLDSIMHFFGIFPTVIEENCLPPTVPSPSLKVYPNPFRSNGIIKIILTGNINPQSALCIYDLAGKLIKSFYNFQSQTAKNFLRWNGTNDFGFRVPAGVYFINLHLNNKRIIERIVLID